MSSHDNNPAATRRRIDALCDEFEATWRAGQRPQVETELEKIESAARPELLKELLLVEWELLEKQGVSIRVEDYVARLPEHETLIRQTLGQRPPEARIPEVIAHYKTSNRWERVAWARCFWPKIAGWDARSRSNCFPRRGPRIAIAVSGFSPKPAPPLR